MGWQCKECGGEDFRLVKDVMVEMHYRIKINKNGSVKLGKQIKTDGIELETDMEYYRCSNCGNESPDGYSGDLKDIAEYIPKRRI
jgi:DNA-directed RNA polymerase subunit RPC12/RpoP